MQETLLHHIWKFNKFQSTNLKTTQNQPVVIKSLGQHNLGAGPDFFNAQISIDGQLWAGNVEIHIKSSDWYVHHHETDVNYDNVILHVVWEHDTDVFRKDNTAIPTLELKSIVDSKFLNNYNQLFQKQNQWIYCEKDFAQVDDFIVSNWLERLYFERLEQKSLVIGNLLLKSKNNWEAVLFAMLAKNFGLNINGEAFLSMATSFDFSIIRKLQSNQQNLEALFFGQAGLLDKQHEDSYYDELIKKYTFVKHKFSLDNAQVLPVQFFRLRPTNFPTIRLSQLARLYHTHPNLFSSIIKCNDLDSIYRLFEVSTSNYWEVHYNFGTPSRKSKKGLTKSFIHLLIINTIVPIKFAYAKSQGQNITESIFDLIQQIPSEKNSIVSKFQDIRALPNSAGYSQALIQLKTAYCDKKRCLQCAIGNSLLDRSF